MIKSVSQNPYRILGVLSNSPLKERVGNQNRLAAFAKIGKETTFPNDFIEVIKEKPQRSAESVSGANAALNLDKDQLKHSFFWFIKGSSIDDIALRHLQAGNLEKAKEIFQKQETFSSLINLAVLSFIGNDITIGYRNISKVIHKTTYRQNLLQALGIVNLQITEDELAELIILELLNEVDASKLIKVCVNDTERTILSKKALEEPIAVINSAIATAKHVDSKNANANLEAGTKLMNSTKSPLKAIKEIAGATSPQYQMAADGLAKQILQCGINYYNNAPDNDVESPRKAMVLQEYALNIAVGKLTKDRCQDNYNILKQAVDNMPPAEVAFETRQIKTELKKFCQLPDKISHSISLLNNTKPLLQTIKTKLGPSNSFYLNISTQVVGNALHNLIEEVNRAQNALGRTIEEMKKHGLSPSLLGASLLDTLKSTVREAWQATLLMDSFDMEYDFRTKRYIPNRNSLKEIYDDLRLSNYTSGLTPSPTTPTPPPPKPGDDTNWGCIIGVIILVIIFIISMLK